MTRRFPLFAKIFCWFLLNLLVLAALAFLAVGQQLRLGLGSLLTGAAGERVRSVAMLIAQELEDAPRDQWDAILKKYDRAYGLHFGLFRHNGSQLAGFSRALPPEVRDRVAVRSPSLKPGPPPPPKQNTDGRQPERHPSQRSLSSRNEPFEPRPTPPEPPPPLAPPPPGETNRFDIAAFVHTGTPARYWLVVNGPFAGPLNNGPAGLVITSDTLGGGGLIVDFGPFLWSAGIALAVSALFWLPMIGSITSEVKRLRNATAEIAEGRFDIRVPAKRRDELGDLGESVNVMAERLSGFVQGQRRFLSDIAHELCAPLSRLQLGLGILEEQSTPTDPKLNERLRDVREEVDHMASLVNDLLSFSKASFARDQLRLVPVNVAELLERMLHRENSAGATVLTECDPAVTVLADPGLLERAVGNLVRNAIRYASYAGPIRVSAAAESESVVIAVRDSGPGVPRDALAHLFDPFFRVDTSRTRQTGGVGLGMTIAKTCVESCGGAISAENNSPSGLSVFIRLAAALK